MIIWQSEQCKEKLAQIKTAGTANLAVIADFDKTLTSKKNSTLHSAYMALTKMGVLSEEYNKASNTLRNHYLPLERDLSLTFEEKTKHMRDWWQKHWDMMVEAGIRKEHLHKIAKENLFPLREGCKEFFEWAQENEVPILIFSAGLGDYITEAVKVTSNITIYSNFFKFDNDGKAIGYSKPFITSTNKAHDDHSINFNKKPIENKNVLLLGDSLEDPGMDSHFNPKSTLKIGYYIHDLKDEARLTKYKEVYDILLSDDELGIKEFLP
jgi:HAD superfamily hydrolase (TIGR01544 family)